MYSVEDTGPPREWEADVGRYGCQPTGFHDLHSDSSDQNPAMVP